ncbi:hypothetical protein CBA19CS11_35480 [Caballeronia novacaledonica]|uniref:hypothetical protein n=1 Tax=Caballeronia novacaledonica TaxID=1544861 RepID=UPI001EE24EF7|nr:hypothetical protein [Caballeronia novacaledonica]GJH14256.1 hypothetical protein CBA19CS11_35480 [Caballeronia novacaledonica]
MKHLSNRPLRLAAAAAMVISLLAACDQSKSPSNTTPASVAQDGKITLLKDISGVWTPTATPGLTTIYYADNRLQILQGDAPLAVTLGDVDPAEETVNVNTVARGKEEILTIRKKWNSDHTAYNLSMTGGDGYQETLGFVRRISNDDLNRISRLTVAKTPAPQPLQPVETSPASIVPSDRGVIDMWLGGIDMNMRSCPGSTCAAVIIVPKDSKLSADTSTIRNVTESSGANTPWVRVTYEGAYCTPAELDQQTGCTPSHGTEAPVTGWMNYSRLLSAPRVQQ